MKPNIVLILADDLGYGDVRANNAGSRIPTPHLDRLAAGGVRFTDAHTNSAMCSPTRYGVMTGRYAWRTWLQSRVLPHFSRPLIEPSRLTLAELLRGQGYAAAAIGKWHLGLGWQTQDGQSIDPRSWDIHQIDAIDFAAPLAADPRDHGFDSFFGLNASNNMVPYCFIEDDHVVGLPSRRKAPVFDTESPEGLMTPGWRSEEIDQNLLARACSWMDDHFARSPDRPFFLYFPTSAIHRPCLPDSDHTGVSGAGLRGDKVTELDDMVGTLMRELDRHGATENTVVIFTSDNGALPGDVSSELQKLADNDYGARWPAASLLERRSEGLYTTHHGRELEWLTYGHRTCGPFLGYKTDIYDGGHRVPFIVHWPQVVAQGRTCDQTICLTDFLATFAEVLEVGLPDDAGEDSFSFLPLLRDGKTGQTRPSVVHHSGDGMFAIRQGDWKLILGNDSGGFWTDRTVNTRGQLFNMASDHGEEENLYAERPEIVDRLDRELAGYRAGRRSR